MDKILVFARISSAVSGLLSLSYLVSYPTHIMGPTRPFFPPSLFPQLNILSSSTRMTPFLNEPIALGLFLPSSSVSGHPNALYSRQAGAFLGWYYWSFFVG